jgi:hypothetical protein
MGKGSLKAGILFGPSAGRRHRCIGCKARILYGERCPPCATEVRVKAAKRRRRR